MTKPLNLLKLTFNDLVLSLQQRYGCGKYHAVGLYREFYKNGNYRVETITEFKRSPRLAEIVQQDLVSERPPVVQHTHGEVTKFVTTLDDGLEIETVVVPMGTRKTLCVSSQVGCQRGCAFCETGKMGFLRNLNVAEIVNQVYHAKIACEEDIRNIVFMGMGEPFDNLENVVRAIAIISDQRGLDIAKKHITVSTVVVNDLHDWVDLNWSTLKLAISLNAPNDRIRSQIMPVNRIFPMGQIKNVLLNFPLHKRSSFFIEYVLIKGINDASVHARELADFLKPLRVKVNVIPLNPGSRTGFLPPSETVIQQFCDWLIDENVFVRKRSEKGANIMAACGQLGGFGSNNFRHLI